MGIGGILGLLGLALTRWENRPEGLFYTPSRWLAFLIVFAIAARVVYGWWHATHAASSAPGNQHWLTTASGTQLSLAIAAGLIGYYLVYSIGVRVKIARHEQRCAKYRSRGCETRLMIYATPESVAILPRVANHRAGSPYRATSSDNSIRNRAKRSGRRAWHSRDTNCRLVAERLAGVH